MSSKKTHGNSGRPLSARHRRAIGDGVRQSAAERRKKIARLLELADRLAQHGVVVAPEVTR